MSHFTVAVVTTPDGDVVDALEPFYEFECSGIKNKYCISESSLDEIKDQYESTEITLMKNSKPIIDDGEERYAFLDDPRFVRDATDLELYAIKNNKGDIFADFPNGGKHLSVVQVKNDDGTYSSRIRDLGMFIQWHQKDVPCTEVFELQQFINWYNEKVTPTVLTGEKPDESWTEWIELDADGKVVDYFTTTNPNPKYDWYEIGGRWKNMLLRLDGRKVDSCPIGELDFETEINRLKTEANRVYDYFEKCIGDASRTWRSWADVWSDESIESVNDKRNFYHNQDAILLMKANDTDNLFCIFGHEFDEFLVSREEFLAKKSANPFGTYCFLDATSGDEIGDWTGSECGMFGLDIRKEEDWENKNQALLKSFPSDYIITIVDCHI